MRAQQPAQERGAQEGLFCKESPIDGPLVQKHTRKVKRATDVGHRVME